MSNSIISKHDKILDFLIKLRKKDDSLYFVPRKIDNKERLSNGFWFIGNERYLQVSFWNGTDWKEKIHNIAFVVLADGSSYIEFSAQDSKQKADFLLKLSNKIGGFQKTKNKNKWYKHYSSNKFRSHLQDFLENEKLVIDDFIRKHKPDGITMLDKSFDDKYVGRVLNLRDKLNVYGLKNKVVKICWNTEEWKYPSGLKGKSQDKSSFEAQNGYGHEEWLLNKTRVIDGYHYSFAEPLRVESGKHIGKTYNVSLYTVDSKKRRFHVGDIKDVECISIGDAKKAFDIYKANGWIDEMVDDIRRVGANPTVFLDNPPDAIFNIKFRFKNAKILDELEKISSDDINISTTRFKLLPKKTDFIIEEVPEDESEGTRRSEAKRKVVFKKEVEYDPLHSIMQNALADLLRRDYRKEYKFVGIEKSRVDVKAKTHDDKFHYFEVKTNAPKMCIRLALGQVMEYAYWAESDRAEKLIIVGDSEPSAEAKNYLKHIRSKFSIPVYYRWFDLEKKTLSIDY